MSSDFLFAYVPLCRMTPPRKEMVDKMINALTEYEAAGFNAGPCEDEGLDALKDALRAAMQDYDGIGSSSMVIRLHFDGMKHVMVGSGGVAFGDDPTEEFSAMSLIGEYNQLYLTLMIWAKEDFKAKIVC